MEIVRFLKWWWGGCDSQGKVLTVIILLLACLAFATLIFGATALLITIIVLVAGSICVLLISIVYAIIDQWKAYVGHREEQQDKVVSRRRGH